MKEGGESTRKVVCVQDERKAMCRSMFIVEPVIVSLVSSTVHVCMLCNRTHVSPMMIVFHQLFCFHFLHALCILVMPQ